jgi:hypothetical protein
MKIFIAVLAFFSTSISESCFAQINYSPQRIIDPINYKSGSMGGYLTLAECYAELDKMQILYPHLITTKKAVGKFFTFENRPIFYVKISDNPNKDEREKKILYNSLHHANEPNSMQQLIYFIWYILENYALDSEIEKLVNSTEIYCIPVVNPDGYCYNQLTHSNGGGIWRKNRRDHFDGQYGVDPNRNYGFAWGNTTSTDSRYYCGTAPFSEPETQAIKWLCEKKQFTVSMNAHTHGKQIFYPYGYAMNKHTPDSIVYKEVTTEMVRYNSYSNILSSMGETTPGDSDDWMYADISTKPKIFAFTPEIGSNYWEATTEAILQNNRDMVYTNLTALRLVHKGRK